MLNKEGKTMALTIANSIGENWRLINSRKRLKEVLEQACLRLDELGHSEIANKWRSNLKNMPAKLSKDAINIVLVMANKELELKNIQD
jgi:hypothetical protein